MRLYDERAHWWPLLSAPADYEEEAAFYLRVLTGACSIPPQTALELGSGGGNNALHMKVRLQLTLTDVSSRMLEISEGLNPECEHIVGDMRSLRLGREFDCVFLHDAVCYMTTEEDLRRAMETAFEHCRDGGAVLFAPDHTRETFRPSTSHGGHDGPDRGLRYLQWTTDPDPADTSYLVDYAYLLRNPDGSIEVDHDRHVEGLFARSRWLELLTDVGFRPEVVSFEHSELLGEDLAVFVCRKSG